MTLDFTAQCDRVFQFDLIGTAAGSAKMRMAMPVGPAIDGVCDAASDSDDAKARAELDAFFDDAASAPDCDSDGSQQMLLGSLPESRRSAGDSSRRPVNSHSRSRPVYHAFACLTQLGLS